MPHSLAMLTILYNEAAWGNQSLVHSKHASQSSNVQTRAYHEVDMEGRLLT